MIKKLRKKIFWITFLSPFVIIFFMVTIYSVSRISAVIDDENDVLDYCSKCVSKYTETIDSYLPMSTNDLIEASEKRSEGNGQVMNLLYSILTSDVSVVKTGSSGDILDYIGETGDSTDFHTMIDTIQNRGKSKGRVNKHIYSLLDEGDANYIILLNTAGWRAEIQQMLLLSLLGLLFSAVGLVFIAHGMAVRVTQPIAESMARQNRFIADASHELKTPVSVINANISVLEKEVGENKWMNYIKEEGRNMNQLINQLLNLSRLDFETSGSKRHKNPVTEIFDMNEVIMEVSLPFDGLAFEKNISISTDLTGSYQCSGSREDFKKILTILLDNALNHAGSGGRIEINAKMSTKKSLFRQKSYITVEVFNSGPVISPEDLPHIFDRFYRAHVAAKDSHCNFGLGLSIAKALADKNSYSLSAASGNELTCFRISLPEA